MSSNPFISVVVPVYKVEPYIRQCIDSVINQDYQNWEMILVDDGSPDNCGAICDEYARNDARIKVIHQENRGLSEARNKGISHSTGEYIFLLDSDDYLPNNALFNLYSVGENFNWPDYIKGNHLVELPDGHKTVTRFHPPPTTA